MRGNPHFLSVQPASQDYYEAHGGENAVLAAWRSLQDINLINKYVASSQEVNYFSLFQLNKVGLRAN